MSNQQKNKVAKAPLVAQWSGRLVPASFELRLIHARECGVGLSPSPPPHPASSTSPTTRLSCGSKIQKYINSLDALDSRHICSGRRTKPVATRKLTVPPKSSEKHRLTHERRIRPVSGVVRLPSGTDTSFSPAFVLNYKLETPICHTGSNHRGPRVRTLSCPPLVVLLPPVSSRLSPISHRLQWPTLPPALRNSTSTTSRRRTASSPANATWTHGSAKSTTRYGR